MKFKNFIQGIFSVKNVYIHKQITILGIKFKFKNKKYVKSKYRTINLSINENRKRGIKVRTNQSYSPEITGQLSYHVLNKLKEQDLKTKIQKGKKLRVIFLLDSISKFSFNSVYLAMKNSSIFEPIIVLCSIYEKQFYDNHIWNKFQKEFEILKNSDYEAYSLYDENRNYIPLDDFKPDILFITAPYFEYYNSAMHFSNIYLNVKYPVCYINYGWIISNNYDYYYNNRRINSCWKNFVFSRTDYTEYTQYSQDCGINAVLSGYPKLDVYEKPIEECKIPQKIDNGNPIVIYAPHWSVVSANLPSDLGTFDLYYKYFLNLLDRYPNINFVFKPHPSLPTVLNANGIMSHKEFENYINKWESHPNGYYEMGGEYIDLFRKSSLLIQDSESFIAEYLPSGNPCMYLVKPSREQETYMDGFSLSARKILNTYYLCYNQEEIEKYFNMIMFDKNDPMKEERQKVKDEIFINIGSAGQKIVDYLEELLKD